MTIFCTSTGMRMSNFAQSIFGAAALHSFCMATLGSSSTKRRRIHILSAAMHAVACASYAFHHPLARIIEWSLTVPLFTTMLNEVCGETGKAMFMYEVAQGVAIVLGGLYPWSRLAFVLSCGLQAHVLKNMHVTFEAMARAVSEPRDARLVRFAHVGTLGLMSVYPVLWAFTQDPGVFVYLDVVTKLLFTSALKGLSGRAYEIDLNPHSVAFWRLLASVNQIPVFAISKQAVVMYWNTEMEDWAEARASDILYTHGEGVLCTRTRRALARQPSEPVRVSVRLGPDTQCLRTRVFETVHTHSPTLPSVVLFSPAGIPRPTTLTKLVWHCS